MDGDLTHVGIDLLAVPEMGARFCKLDSFGSPVGDQSATSDTSSGCLTLTADGKVLMDVSQLKQLLLSNGGERQVLLQLNESIGPLQHWSIGSP